ncbi:MAG: OB-fold nucleic acid binding domain-containing protein [Vicinamibacterales bacterium]
MLNNQPMGFYHPATLVKDAQRHGVSFAPIDVQESGWHCHVMGDGRVRLGLMYVNGLRQEVGRAIEAAGHRRESAHPGSPAVAAAHGELSPHRCPKCGCDDPSMLEATQEGGSFCNICAHEWRSSTSRTMSRDDLADREPANGAPANGEPGTVNPRTTNSDPSTLRQAQGRPEPSRGATGSGLPRARSGGEQRTTDCRFSSIEDLIARTGIRRDELATLAEIGALNAFGHDRRSALWQIERAIRPAGEMFDEARETAVSSRSPHSTPGREVAPERPDSPLRPMTPPERLMADYAGTSLTIGPHPLALRRMELAMRGVLRAIDLPRGKHGRRVRVAGAVITRQRPGTAKGFVFLTLEDETGIANIIVRPDLFGEQRATIVGSPYLLVEGVLQIQEGVTSIKAERVVPLGGTSPEPQSHDFR